MNRSRCLGFLTLICGFAVLLGGDVLAYADKKADAEKYTNDLLTSKDAKVRVTAVEELAKIGQIQKPLIKDAEPEMVKAMTDKELTVRLAALKCVGMIDPDVKEVMPIYVKALNEEKDASIRLAAISGLAQMGPNAKDAAKDLRKIVKDEDKASKLSKAAKNALKVITPKK